MKVALIILSFLFVNNIYSQIDLNAHENSVFLVCRGTKLKRNIISKDFNLSDQNCTHIGIGFIENGNLKIYNISTGEENPDKYYYIDTYESFTNINGIFYASIWEHKTTLDEIKKLKKLLDEYSLLNIHFDNKFDLDNGDNLLYCSEFVYKVLKKLNSTRFDYTPSEKKLNTFYSSVLKKENLIYIPVDFFQKKDLFTNIYEIFYTDIK